MHLPESCGLEVPCIGYIGIVAIFPPGLPYLSFCANVIPDLFVHFAKS